MRKHRIGARGVRKVKTGCQTCKIRHKKCDEAKPSCHQCSSTGRQCDFTPVYSQPSASASEGILERSQISPRFPSNLPVHEFNTSNFETDLFHFFQIVCAKEFALYFGNPLWENLVLRAAFLEPSIYHAALAISALSRTHYTKERDWCSPRCTISARHYSLIQYNLAIRSLNARLDGSGQSSWLAVLASIIFINLESLQGDFTLTSMHLHGGLSLVRNLGSSPYETGHLEDALYQIQDEVTCLKIYGRAE